MLFQISQLLFSNILLLDIPKNLLDIFFKYVIVSKYNLGRIPSYNSNFFFNYFVVYEIVDISLDLIEGYIIEVADNIYYFSRLTTKQILVEKDIDIYRYKEIIELNLIFIKNIRYLDNSNIFLYYKCWDGRGLGVFVLRRSGN
jgi:hypothetical protein